jgi:hypothetical protein
MAYPVTLPILAGLSLVGTALGVHLGRSAIAEINPAYFSEREAGFHADLSPYRSPDWAQVQVTEYQQAALVQGLGDGCVGCREYPEEYYPRHDPAVDGLEDGWAASARSEEPIETIAAEPASNPEWERVERYASYPVSADEQQAESDAELTEAIYAATD